MDKFGTKNNTFSDSFSYKELALRLATGIKHMGWCVIILSSVCAFLNVSNTYISYEPLYSASTTFAISTNGTNTYYNSNNLTQLEDTFPYIITSSVLNNIVAKDLDMNSVPGSITASALPGTGLFTIKVSSSDYELAYKVIRSVLNNYQQVSKSIIGETSLVLISPPTASSTPINAPSYQNNAIAGAIIGAIIGLVAVFIYTAFRSTIRNADEIEELLNTTKLGVIGRIKPKDKTNPYLNILDKELDFRFIESVSSLRNKIIRLCEKDQLKSIMITSTAPDEGKTTIAINLAISLAKKKYRTVLIDADLRNPSIKTQMGVSSETKSIINVLSGEAPLEDTLTKISNLELYVLFGEKKGTRKAAELIGGKSMRKLLDTLHKNFDYIIIDIPPAGIISDALTLKHDVDAAICVVRQDFSPTVRIIDTIKDISSGKTTLLGVVFNNASGRLSTSNYGRYGGYKRYGQQYYGYGYGKTQKPEPQEPPEEKKKSKNKGSSPQHYGNPKKEFYKSSGQKMAEREAHNHKDPKDINVAQFKYIEPEKDDIKKTDATPSEKEDPNTQKLNSVNTVTLKHTGFEKEDIQDNDKTIKHRDNKDEGGESE